MFVKTDKQPSHENKQATEGSSVACFLIGFNNRFNYARLFMHLSI